MKKKDLVPGELYADKRGTPRLLINTLVWSQHGSHRDAGTWYLLHRGARPHQSFGYGSRAAGMLVVQVGSVLKNVGDLQEWSRERGKYWAERLSAIQHKERGTLEHHELIHELQREVQEKSFYLTVDNHTTWEGTWEEVSEKLNERSRGVEESYKKLDERHGARTRRVHNIQAELSRRYGVDSTTPFMVTVRGAHDTSRAMPNGITLSLGDLETILDIRNEELG